MPRRWRLVIPLALVVNNAANLHLGKMERHPVERAGSWANVCTRAISGDTARNACQPIGACVQTTSIDDVRLARDRERAPKMRS